MGCSVAPPFRTSKGYPHHPSETAEGQESAHTLGRHAFHIPLVANRGTTCCTQSPQVCRPLNIACGPIQPCSMLLGIEHVAFPANRTNQLGFLDVFSQLVTQARYLHVDAAVECIG